MRTRVSMSSLEGKVSTSSLYGYFSVIHRALMNSLLQRICVDQVRDHEDFSAHIASHFPLLMRGAC